jgi:UPF0755 protein
MPPANTSLLLRPGYSTRRIAIELKKAGVIRSVFAFRAWHVLHPKPSLKAGEYLFERESSLPQVYDRIVRGDIYFHVVTIPEGYTMFDIAKAMEDAGLGAAADFLHIAETQTQLISDLAPEAKSLEILPNTSIHAHAEPGEMMAAMVHRSPGGAADRLNRRTQDCQPSFDRRKENAADERPRVPASTNRLADRMALDADPAIYAELLAGTYTGSAHADLAVPPTTPHVAAFAGLIGILKSALEAALHPDSTKFFYFVSDGNGHHRFARSLEEHNKNVTAYRPALGMR